MMFVSYAQNFEDVMLWRALGHVERGFYVDVGANHPSVDSVTQAFYERGWHGINIEPLPSHAQELRSARPRDINLQVAVGAQNGEIELFDTPVRGLATASPEVAQRHAKAGLQTARSRVPLRRLADICEEHAPADIHFLKIDVEGFEAQVLAGMDLKRFRPWVLLVEATIPNSQEIDAAWEPQVLEAGYRFVYFDGLNRYYVPLERLDELARHFAAPPNVFDDFAPADLVQMRAKAEDLNARLARALEDLDQAQLLCSRLREVEQELVAMRNSTSWRLTQPLRAAMERFLVMRRDMLALAEARTARAAALLQGLPRLRRLAGRVTRLLGIHDRVLRLVHAAELRGLPQSPLFPADETGGNWPHLATAALPAQTNPPQAARMKMPPPAVVPRIRLTGHVEGHYSLAIVNRGLALGLEAQAPGKVAFQPYHGQPYESPQELPDAQAEVLRALFERRNDFVGNDVVSIVHHYPVISDEAPASQRLIFFFWEETAIPAETICRLNENFDGVLVAADFVRRALINSGCHLPVFVVPLGIDHLIGADTPPLPVLQPAPGQFFRFLHVSSVFARKGPDTLLRAFLDTFSSDDEVELYVKTFPNPHNRIAEQLRELSAGRSRLPRVVIDESPLDDAGLLALYRSAQAMVLPTRGEGFNLPAAEALALGLPLIVTGHGAHLDFATRSNALLIPFQFAHSSSHVRSGDACWVNANPEALGELMRQVVREVREDDAGLEARRTRGVREVRDIYMWQRCAAAVHNSVAWLAQSEPLPARRRLALVSPWHTRCGIAEYSHNLFSGFSQGEDWQLRVFCDMRTSADVRQDVHVPSWRVGDAASVEATLAGLDGRDYDTLVVQHQPSLFPLTTEVCCHLASIAAQGCIVVLELHSTLPLLGDQHPSARALAALRRIDRIVVHKVDDLNHLLSLGLCDNVMLLAHGVVQPLPPERRSKQRADLGIPDEALVLGSFGFALPHKGGDTLVRALQPLARALGRPVHLLGLNSILDPRSEQTLGNWKKLARKLGVEAQVSWISDYRPIDECQDLLGLADYVVFPYRHTRESASGAVTIGLAAQKPVLVSPLGIFSDVADCTWKMAGHEVEDVIAAICQLEADKSIAAGLLERQTAWLASRDWQRVSDRFAGMLGGLRRQRQLAAVTQPVPVENAALPRRLFVDISELYFRDARTGIQRVVRSVLNELFVAPPTGFEICPVFAEKGLPWRLTPRYAPPGHPATGLPEGEVIHPQEGDIFLGLDLGAHLFPEAEASLRDFRRAGAKVFFVVYDIIPLRHPEFSLAGISQAFQLWMQGLARNADGLLCISAAVAEDVRNWLRENEAPLPHPEVRHFHLGADIASSLPTSGRPKDGDNVLAALEGGPVFLSVGTIEPRKGQEQLLGACELLWEDGSDVRLVLVGKEGWLMEEFAARLRQHPEAGHRLFWLEGISDEFLEEVYGKSSALVAASQTEGFGLPLIEAAQHGIPLIARDIPVFRELAGSHAYYFSGNRPSDLAGALRRWLELRAAGKIPESAGMGWLTWKESTAAIKAILQEDLA